MSGEPAPRGDKFSAAGAVGGAADRPAAGAPQVININARGHAESDQEGSLIVSAPTSKSGVFASFASMRSSRKPCGHRDHQIDFKGVVEGRLIYRSLPRVGRWAGVYPEISGFFALLISIAQFHWRAYNSAA